ncbi:acyl-CoA thioester hydrolase/BAAT C-terminal domain-containing protein [Tenacibaculum halocynthiae]|uniref:acyl-CoA thioester hydrolase/BAAT C-terminal domain-containing protein n=1 Tax=Tenacibaculum halocynthiae TaxID=1254437 RepID=UPI003D65B6EC
MTSKRKYIISIGIITLLIIAYYIVNLILFTGIKLESKFINENGFQANYFVKDKVQNKASIILIGGGQWGDYWAKEFAKKEMVGLSLPYTRKEGFPELPEEIKLEYFENAIKWLKKQKEVNPTKIVVMGASRNAELALVIASIFPESISGVIAYAPSSVSWSNTVLPYNSNELKPSWKYKGKDIPYVPMNKISGNDSGKIKMIEYWNKGLTKIDMVNKAFIKVENINGPIILFSGNDDLVWPSSIMADMIEERLKEKSFNHSFQNVKYKNAGHLISSNPEATSNYRTGLITIEGKKYEYEFGGTNKGDSKAKKDAKIKLMEYLKKI